MGCQQGRPSISAQQTVLQGLHPILNAILVLPWPRLELTFPFVGQPENPVGEPLTFPANRGNLQMVWTNCHQGHPGAEPIPARLSGTGSWATVHRDQIHRIQAP